MRVTDQVADVGDERLPVGYVDPRALLVELRQAPGLPVGNRQGGAGLHARPDEATVDRLGLERVLNPPPRVATEQARGGHISSQPARGAGHVQTLPPRAGDERIRPVDASDGDAVYLEELVNGGVAGYAQDHAASDLAGRSCI